jgi:hypothetical protein
LTDDVTRLEVAMQKALYTEISNDVRERERRLNAVYGPELLREKRPAPPEHRRVAGAARSSSTLSASFASSSKGLTIHADGNPIFRYRER